MVYNYENIYDDYESLKEHEMKIELEKQKKNQKIIESSKKSSEVDYNEFMEACYRELDLLKTNRISVEEAFLPVYTPTGKYHIIAIYKNDSLYNIGYTKNITSWLGANVAALKKEDGYPHEFSISYILKDIDDYMEDRLTAYHIITKIRIPNVAYDSKIFLSKTLLGQHLRNIYGITAQKMKKVFERHLEITEYICGDRIIFFKAEIDAIVKQDILDGKLKV